MPPLALVSLTSSVLISCTAALAVIAARSSSWSGWAEPLIVAIALSSILIAPMRIGPLVSLTTVAAFFGIELAADHRISASSIGLGALLVSTLLAASYVRLGLRRREAELGLAQDAVAELTRRDRITELLASGRELTWLEAELTRSRRHHRQFTLLLTRPDGIDALEGEEARLEVLEAVAEAIGRELRATDVALRFDATTYALILPETTSEGARLAAERIRLLLPARLSESAGLTISSGIASFPRDATTDEELSLVARRALDRAMELGGNRTLCASAEPGVPAGWVLTGGATD